MILFCNLACACVYKNARESLAAVAGRFHD